MGKNEIASFQYSKLSGLYYACNPKTATSAIRGYRGSYSWLSNFYSCTFVMSDEEFCCSEQGYMWLKSDDTMYRRAIMAERHPGRIKKLGRSAILPYDWDDVGRYAAMYKVLSAKFSTQSMRKLLLDTEFAYLEETNFHGDTHWGTSGVTGHGKNHLGRLQMCVRTELFEKDRMK